MIKDMTCFTANTHVSNSEIQVVGFTDGIKGPPMLEFSGIPIISVYLINKREYITDVDEIAIRRLGSKLLLRKGKHYDFTELKDLITSVLFTLGYRKLNYSNEERLIIMKWFRLVHEFYHRY